MLVYEVLSGLVPFHRYNEPVALLKILHGEHPERPRGGGGWFPDGLWETLKLCWRKEPGERPGLDAVLRSLEEPARLPPRLSYDAGGYHDTSDAAATNESSAFHWFS